MVDTTSIFNFILFKYIQRADIAFRFGRNLHTFSKMVVVIYIPSNND